MNKWSKKRFWGYAKSVEVKNYRSDWKGTGTQTRKTGNHIGNQIWKPIGIFEENWKPNAYLKQKICELQWAPKLQNLSFLAQKWKNRSKKKNCHNRKTEIPRPYSCAYFDVNFILYFTLLEDYKKDRWFWKLEKCIFSTCTRSLLCGDIMQ